LLNIKGKETILQAGDCAIFYDDIDFTRSVIEPITFIILQFQPNPSCPFRIPVPVGKVDFLNPHRVRDSIQKYETLMDRDDPRSIYYKEHLLEDILLQAYGESLSADPADVASNTQMTHDITVIRATGYIRENLDKKLTIDTVCRAAETNSSTLNFKFRKELSVSVGGYITAERMKRAKRMLSNTTHTIRDIASRCGFESVYYFSSAFHKYNGISPTEYRKKYR
jgi:AraC-like DNA-binding protein